MTGPTHIGSYRIERELGRGGMGVVHLGYDPRLDRHVAIKELPEALSGEPDRLARFEREARTLAQLNHPNVTAIHGVEEHEGRRFLILEYVEGESLEQRIARGPVPVDEALAIAAEIAAGVAAAHDAGVVHRDLKPGNVIVRPDGHVSVLDFGLARSAEPEAASDAHAPTVVSPASPTIAGVILGTAAYMSPEQARGRPVDRRTDVWSFGVVLYEMLTGDRLFDGETVSDCIAAVLQREIDLERLPSDTPASVRAILTRCLDRDRDARRRDLGDVGMELERVRRGDDDRSPSSARPVSRVPWIVAAVALLVCLVVVGRAMLAPSATEPVTPTPLVASINTPPGTELSLRLASPTVPRVSPDGRWLVYGAQDASRAFRLYLVDLATGTTRVVEGTERGQYPFWSPDSRSIGFFANGRGLLRVERDGGPPRVLDTEAGNGKGGTWSSDGRIVYSPNPRSGLHVVGADAGTPALLIDLDRERGDLSLRHPRLLPGEDTILYFRRDQGNVSDGQQGEIRVCRLDGSDDQLLVTSFGNGIYDDGHLLYVVDDALVARPFDLGRLEFTGEARIVADDVLVLPGASLAVFDVSRSGALTYVSDEVRPQRERFVWYDRDGTRGDVVLDDLDLVGFRLIGDRTRVTANLLGEAIGDLQRFVIDLATGERQRLEENIPSTALALVSHDATRFAHVEFTDDGDRILVSRIGSFAAPLEIGRIESPGTSPVVRAWTADDRALVVSVGDFGGDGPSDQWFLYPADGVADPTPLDVPVVGAEVETSPDGRFFAFVGTFRDASHVFVAPVDDPSAAVRVSGQPAGSARWRADGQELFFQGVDGVIFVVDTRGDDPARFGPPRPLFDLGVAFEAVLFGIYDVAADGQRFLVSEPMADDRFSTFTVMTDWRGSLER